MIDPGNYPDVDKGEREEAAARRLDVAEMRAAIAGRPDLIFRARVQAHLEALGRWSIGDVNRSLDEVMGKCPAGACQRSSLRRGAPECQLSCYLTRFRQ